MADMVEDSNGFLHPSSGFYVIDANGVVLHRPAKKNKKLKPNKKKVTLRRKQLRLLEKAIWFDRKYRRKFLKEMKKEELKARPVEMLRESVLCRCWDELKWRPSVKGTTVCVLKASVENPYSFYMKL